MLALQKPMVGFRKRTRAALYERFEDVEGFRREIRLPLHREKDDRRQGRTGSRRIGSLLGRVYFRRVLQLKISDTFAESAAGALLTRNLWPSASRHSD